MRSIGLIAMCVLYHLCFPSVLFCSPNEEGIQVLADVDGAVLKEEHGCSIDNETHTASFNLTEGRSLLHVRILVPESPYTLRTRFNIDTTKTKGPQKNILKQGLFTSVDGSTWERREFVKQSDNWYCIDFTGQPEIQIACDAPYGQKNIDRLVSLVSQDTNVEVRTLGEEPRTFPIFCYGLDDGKKPIHYIWAGECNYETAAQWAADAMVRYLHERPDVVSSMTEHHLLRIVVKVSPYTYTHGNGMNFFSDDETKNLYAAATWAKNPPPAEMKHLKNEVLGITEESPVPKHINDRRIHFVLSMHSYKTQGNESDYQFINESKAGIRLKDYSDKRRQEWASMNMQKMTSDFPAPCNTTIRKCWAAGLARDYLLEEYQMITFRVEVTTVNSGVPQFAETGRAIIDNLNALGADYDWTHVYPPTE